LSSPKPLLEIRAAIANAAPGVRDVYALMRRPPRYELYDLKADPHESRNLADEPKHDGIRKELQNRLAAWRAQTGDDRHSSRTHISRTSQPTQNA
jgi:hypothetical protein